VDLNPETFFNSIPKDLEANVEFRKKLHTYLESDPDEQDRFILMCLKDPKIAFNSCFWTVNPRGRPGLRNWPFILRPKQEEVVDVMHYCVTEQCDMGINKSRDEGCTEIVCKMAALYLFEPDTYGVVGSRNKDLVDCLGDPYTLMAKIDYALSTMPLWMQKYMGKIERKEMQLRCPKFNSTIKGETTNESFSAGRRSTFMFLDEFGRVEPRIAKSIEGSVHDVTGCVIYGSTHWYGESHPFNDALKKRSTKVVNLPWWENPVKNQGLYKSPDYSVVEIVDVEYYRTNYPDLKCIHTRDSFRIRDLDKFCNDTGYSGPMPKFVADGCESIPGDVRSPWHDAEEEKRKGNKRDFISNVWMSPIGSQDSFFDGIVLERIKGEYIKPHDYQGEIYYNFDLDGRVGNNIKFMPDTGRNRLKWWGSLKNLRPFSNHSFVIGCDLSYGTGNSNSVAAIYNVNTQELVGTWVCPNTPPDKFVDMVTAIARWCNEALVIYESNGPGSTAHKRFLWNGYTKLYVQRTEDAKTRKEQNKYGWHSNPNVKEALLGEFGTSLSESLRSSVARRCIIHCSELLHELRSYVFYENGDIGVSEEQDVTSGARKRHGDRVIAAALCVLGSRYQSKKQVSHKKVAKFGSFMWFQEQKEQENQKNYNKRKIIY